MDAEITLSEPRMISLELDPYKYPNYFNISLYGACNGAINVTVADGVSPYTWLWSDGNTSQNRTALCAENYFVTVFDNNGCKFSSKIVTLIQPERSDWQMGGNSNVNPATQFIGTTDSTSLSFRTNNIQRFGINANGTIRINSFSGSGNKTIYADSLGILRSWASLAPSWELLGNSIVDGDFIGSLNPKPLRFITDNHDRMSISADGKFSIGNFNTANFEWNRLEILVDGATPVSRGISIGTDPGNGGTVDGSFNFYVHDFQNNNGFYFKQIYQSSPGVFTTKTMFSIDSQGRATIGSTQDNNFKLTVCGPIKCTKVKVVSDWWDSVFDEDYEINPIPSLKSFIKNEHHLPEIPTASEIETNGLDVGQMIGLHMKKIEELTLYVIELHDENVALRERVKVLEQQSKRKTKHK